VGGGGVMEVEVAVEVAATDLAAVAMVLAGDVEDTLLSVVMATHFADSPAVPLVQDSAGCRDFPRGDFLVAEIMAVSGIATLGAMGISEITTNAIIAISSTILISLRSVFLIGGTLTMDTLTTDIPTRTPITIPHRLTVTSIGKIWR
jgi:hypothetical protein